MDFSRFFIDRPIFAAVLSIVIFAAGLIAIPLLPISEYPEVVPPSVVVRTVYPGANPRHADVATPRNINGVEDMMYLSVAGSDGVLRMTVAFCPVPTRTTRRCACRTASRRLASPLVRPARRDDAEAAHLPGGRAPVSPDGKCDTLLPAQLPGLRASELRACGRRRRRPSAATITPRIFDPESAPRQLPRAT